MLLKEILKLTGTYVSSENEDVKEIEPVNREVSVNYQADTTGAKRLSE